MVPSVHAQTHRVPRIAVIGAGLSGLSAARALQKAGLEWEMFELGSQVGGLWVYQNDAGRGGAYESLVMNTSSKMSAFSELPFPDTTPAYPSRAEVAHYLANYAERFDLLRRVKFRTEVTSVSPTLSDRPFPPLRLITRDLDTGTSFSREFDAVIVANGHHFTPSFPSGHPSKSFSGDVLHSSAYQTPHRPLDFTGKRVCVVGIGNSAADIASELSAVASQVFLSVRRGAWVLPKFLFGKPVDQGTLVPLWLPGPVRRRLVTWGTRLFVGRMEDFGLPRPDHNVGEAHPTLSDRLLQLVKNGQIQVRGPIRQMADRHVLFEPTPGSKGRDAAASHAELDAIIYCTGYAISFPFFANDFVSAPNNQLPLFGRVFHPEQRRIFFVGLAQTIGAIAPTAERQAHWIAEHIRGGYSLPDPDELNRIMREAESARKRRFVASNRHTIQVDPHEFNSFLARELKRGRQRAQARKGQAFPGNASTPSAER